MTIVNLAKNVGWTLLNATASGLAGRGAGALVTRAMNPNAPYYKTSDNIFCGIFGIIASTLPPASSDPFARTICAALGGLSLSIFINSGINAD